MQSDLQHLHLKKEFSQNRDGWKDAIERPTDARMEKTLNDDDDINLILPINIVCML